MKDKVFLDTNILVYSYSSTEKDKQIIARKLIAESNSYISTQVIQEFLNTLTKKFGITWDIAKNAAGESIQNNSLFVNNEKTIIQACELAQKYRYSFYDSLIISAALSCSCVMLCSEDLQHGQIIEDSLKIVNPFL
jgi:predicted nucleic acid-binding protein